MLRKAFEELPTVVFWLQAASFLRRKVRDWLLGLEAIHWLLFSLPLYETITRIRQVVIALTVTGVVAALIVLAYRANLANRPLQAIPRA